MSLSTIFANKIREFLKESGMTRKAFAEKADIGLSTLNGILNGGIPNPTYFTVMKIAQSAEISLDEIGGLTSKGMGPEEVERVLTEYKKNEEQIRQTLREYTSTISHQEETDAYNREIIRRQDLRIASLEKNNADKDDRIAYQKKAIYLQRISIVVLALISITLLGLIVAIFIVPPTKNLFT